jgi:hypothetical protein
MIMMTKTPWLAFTGYGYGFFLKHRNVTRKFTVNYAVKP